jgi:hypothetical protein
MRATPEELLSKLHAVTGPELTPPAPESPLAWWIAVALVGALLIGIILFWRRRDLRRSQPPGSEARVALGALPATPNIAALASLDQLARRYLSRCYGVAAKRMTSPELLAALPADASTAWAEIFEPSDRWRFAGVLPTQAAWSELLRRAAILIQADCGEVADR